MTTAKSLKHRIRARMAETGERYTTARMHVLGSDQPSIDIPGRVPGYETFGGGSHPDTGVVHNMLVAAGIVAPHDGEPYSDALLYGLGGGTGFLYAVFEYRGMDPMLSVGVRHTMMGHDFARTALERSGVHFDVVHTTSISRADGAIDGALERGVAPIVTVDGPSLPHSGVPDFYRGASADQVAVIGADAESFWIDHGAPIRLSKETFRSARGAYKKARNQTMIVRGAGDLADLRNGVRAAIEANLRNFEESPFRGFASNWGHAGMEKWARLLVDRRDPKCWSKVFSADRLLFKALTQVRSSIEWEFTPPAAGRETYADFLDEASAILESERLAGVAGDYRALGSEWKALADAATAGPAIFEEWQRLRLQFRRQGSGDSIDIGRRRRRIFDQLEDLSGEAVFDDGFREARLTDMADRVERIGVSERRAAQRLAEAVHP